MSSASSVIPTCGGPAIGEMRTALLDWYDANRRSLPWRGADPYGVWVSEVMLQQTQAATVAPYYTAFLNRFPTLAALAAAPLEAVLAAWSGLGYYSRARNLHAAARALAAGGWTTVPDDAVTVEALPGIGDYTAGALLSIAYGHRRPALDANAVRVLARLFAIPGSAASGATRAALRESAADLVPADRPGDWNQAVMELGATVCAAAAPACGSCPVSRWCAAHASGRTADYPARAPRRPTVAVHHAAAVVRRADGRYLVARRAEGGLWGGLWEFPRVECRQDEPPECAAVRAAAEVAGFDVVVTGRAVTVAHSVTHHRISLHAYHAVPAIRAQRAAARACEEVRWVTGAALAALPLSSPQARVRRAVTGRG